MPFADEMNRFSIRDMENLTGIKAHTLRIWEQRYGIIVPKRTDTNIRFYDGDDLKSALRVSLLNNHGYKISAINKMSEEAISNLIDEITDADFRLKATVNQLLEYTLKVDCESFENAIDEYVSRHGIESAAEQLLFAFLEKVGLMWMTDKIFPAQEHIVSNIITRKLALATESQRRKRMKRKQSILLFLPEGEIHDIGLLYIQFLVLKNGHYPLYLGQSTPLSEAKFIYDLKHPEAIYIHITSAAENFDIAEYLKALAKTFPKTQVFLSGAMLHGVKLKLPRNISILYSLADVKNSVESL